MGHDLANGTHVGRRAGQGSASQVPQNQEAVWAASGKKGLGAETGPSPGELGIIPQLMQTTATWKKSRAQGTCKCGLRQALMGALLMELAARLQKLGADAPAQQRLSKAKLLSTEPLAWHYVKWNQDKQCHESTEAAPLLHDNAPWVPQWVCLKDWLGGWVGPL